MQNYVDVDFPLDSRYVMGDLGKPPDKGLCRNFADVMTVIPEKDREEIIRNLDKEGGIERFVTRIYDQKTEGSCVANAFCQAHEILQFEQYGKVIPLSAISLYKRIGYSPGSGAMVSDGLREARDRGIIPLDTPENRAIFDTIVMPNTGFYTPYPAGWERVARDICFIEYIVLQETEELLTAGCEGLPVVVGRKGHSICYVRPTYMLGNLTYGYANSWRLDWGRPWGKMSGGFGFDSYNNIVASSDWCVALRAVKAKRPDQASLSLAV